MAQVFVKYNPYKMETNISINGKAITKDSGLYKIIKGKRLQEKYPQACRLHEEIQDQLYHHDDLRCRRNGIYHYRPEDPRKSYN